MGKCLVAVLLLCSMSLAGEDSTANEPVDNEEEHSYSTVTKKRYSNYVGIAGGLVTGYGLSIRKWFTDAWGAQLTLFPFYREENYDEKGFSLHYDRDSGYAKIGDLSVGLTALRRFSDMKYIRFMGYAGANMKVDYENYDYYEEDEYYDISRSAWRDSTEHNVGKDQEETLSAGLGAGVEFYVWRFAFNLMLGLVGSYGFESQSYGIGPSIEGGLFFRF
ncbi:MAG: hypothetical protein GF418_08020 [Chitinivibrionales bacterium]|nr:hypothetical protein [Chitinivibrionales bacterium]MBD3395559.1 hypothetical protein [Chitinivibrionales bacterium]